MKVISLGKLVINKQLLNYLRKEGQESQRDRGGSEQMEGREKQKGKEMKRGKKKAKKKKGKEKNKKETPMQVPEEKKKTFFFVCLFLAFKTQRIMIQKSNLKARKTVLRENQF